MQTIFCGLIIGLALIYVANRWLPTKIKLRMLRKPAEVIVGNGSCSSCSSCGNCGSSSNKLVKK